MAKSYVPQLIRMLEKVCVYIVKHQNTMSPYLSTSQNAFLQSIVSGCQAAFGTVNEEPQP